MMNDNQIQSLSVKDNEIFKAILKRITELDKENKEVKLQFKYLFMSNQVFKLALKDLGVDIVETEDGIFLDFKNGIKDTTDNTLEYLKTDSKDCVLCLACEKRILRKNKPFVIKTSFCSEKCVSVYKPAFVEAVEKIKK